MVENEIENRSKVIVRTSIVGIATNVVLSAFKAAIGFVTGSIAVTLDAVNNLSDALSSVITIVGAKLANKLPDKKHPLGYGRIEYLSAMIVAAIVLYAGGTSAVESVKKIIQPEAADYSTVSLVIIAAAVVVKLVLGKYVKRQGERVNSGALVASGADALFDAILSASVLASAIVFVTTGISLEAYVGVLISLFIIRSGIEMLKDTLDDILGKRMEPEFLSEIRKTIHEDPDVQGVFDLILHSYGPEKLVGSVHVEVADTMTADAIDLMERRIARHVYEKCGVMLTGIGIYSMNTKDDEAHRVQTAVTEAVMSTEYVIQIHGFYVDLLQKMMRFDIIVDFAAGDRKAVYREAVDKVQKLYPEYRIIVVMDSDVSD